jgi:threonine aldolase
LPSLHNPDERGFASDNYAGIHPEILAAISDANHGTRWPTAATSTPPVLQEVFKGHFGEQAEAFPVFNGTGANVTACRR